MTMQRMKHLTMAALPHSNLQPRHRRQQRPRSEERQRQTRKNRHLQPCPRYNHRHHLRTRDCTAAPSTRPRASVGAATVAAMAAAQALNHYSFAANAILAKVEIEIEIETMGASAATASEAGDASSRSSETWQYYRATRAARERPRRRRCGRTAVRTTPMQTLRLQATVMMREVVHNDWHFQRRSPVGRRDKCAEK